MNIENSREMRYFMCLIVIVFLLSLPIVQLAAGAVPNGDFEAAGNPKAGWSFSGGTIVSIYTSAFSGLSQGQGGCESETHCVKIQPDASHPSAVIKSATALIPPSPTGKYQVGPHFKFESLHCTSMDRAFARVNWLKADGTSGGTSAWTSILWAGLDSDHHPGLINPIPEATWSAIGKTVTPPSGAVKFNVTAGIQSCTGKIWFDDFVFFAPVP